MLCPRYDESSCQSYKLLYHLLEPVENVKSLNDSGWSPFFNKITSFFEVLLPKIPIQTFIRRLVIKADVSYYSWTYIRSNQGWIENLRVEEECEKYRETQVSRTGATCPIRNISEGSYCWEEKIIKSWWWFRRLHCLCIGHCLQWCEQKTDKSTSNQN